MMRSIVIVLHLKIPPGQSTSMQCLSGTMQQVPTDFEDHAVTGGVGMKGRCRSCSIFFCAVDMFRTRNMSKM